MGTARSFVQTSGTSLASTVVALDSGDWTIAAWVNATTTGAGNAGAVAQLWTGANAARQVFRFNSASRDILCRQVGATNASAVSSTLLTLANWYAIVGTFRASDGKCRIFYGDEQTPMVEMAYASQTTLATRSTGGTGLVLGNVAGGGSGWDGGLCNEIVDGREWALAEMEYFRLTGRPPSLASLRCWFPLEGSSKATAERDKAGLVADATVTSTQGFTTGPGLWLPRKVRPRRLVAR